MGGGVALLPAKYDTMDQMMLFINMLAKPWELRCIFKRYGKVRVAALGLGGGKSEGGRACF